MGTELPLAEQRRVTDWPTFTVTVEGTIVGTPDMCTKHANQITSDQVQTHNMTSSALFISIILILEELRYKINESLIRSQDSLADTLIFYSCSDR